MASMAGVRIPFSLAAAAAAVLFLCGAASAANFVQILKKGVGEDEKDQCVYTLYIRTGTIWKGGTNSKIGLTIEGSDGLGIAISDLEAWGGLMGEGHDYYERGNLDIFSGRAPCLVTPACRANLSSDGSGPNHGWYVNYVEVTSTGPHLGCSQVKFTVEQWIATDAPPYQLYAVRDYCGGGDSVAGRGDDDDEVVVV